MHRPLLVLLLLAVVFGTVQALRPANRGLRKPWRDTGVDLAWGLLGPLVSKPFARLVTFLAVLGLAVRMGWPLNHSLVEGFGPLGAQPAWLQAVALLGVLDFAGYWTHRLAHLGWLWRAHAVHHSSERLTWLSAVRVHPVDDALHLATRALVAISLGFSPAVLAGVVPILTLYAVFLHANVRMDLGPLRYVVATPAFHRWHHTAEEQGLDRNFAGLLPVWDLLFGTFYLPDRPPVRYGVTDGSVPAGFFGQLLHPFRLHAE